MTRPAVLRSDAEPWQKVHPSVRNQVSIMRWFGVRDYMKEATLTEVVQMWEFVQSLKPENQGPPKQLSLIDVG